MGWLEWKHRVADALVLEVLALPHGKLKRSILRKAKALRLCGTYTKVRECESCGEARPGSGVQLSGKGAAQPCQNRCCALCARRASAEYRATLGAAVEALEPVNGWSFKFITLTKQYDPTDPEGLTVDGLRRRASEMAEACRALWRKLKAFGEKGEGACQFKVEIAGTGNVHAHMLVYSPYLDMGWVQSVTGCGHVWINVVAEGAEKGGIAEVTKYVTKVPSAMSETWLEGTWRKVLHPTLAARWEIATHKMQTRGLMGAFRGVKVAEETDAEAATEAEEIEKTLPEADEETACECCGTVGEFTTATRKTQEWVRECHSHGKKALWGSRWEPPEKAPR